MTSGPGPSFSFTVQGGDCVYTLSTVPPQADITRPPPASMIPPSAPLRLPFTADFETRVEGEPGRFFEDYSGTFLIRKIRDGRQVLQQSVPLRPLEWEMNIEPFTVVGDQRFTYTGGFESSWTNYRVTAVARVTGASKARRRALPGTGSGDTLLVRAGYGPDQVSGACLDSGECFLGQNVSINSCTATTSFFVDRYRNHAKILIGNYI